MCVLREVGDGGEQCAFFVVIVISLRPGDDRNGGFWRYQVRE